MSLNKGPYDDYEIPPAGGGFNPLIVETEIDTLNNIHDAIATLQQLTITPLGGELTLNQASTSGLFVLLDAIRGALHFVLAQRPDKDD